MGKIEWRAWGSSVSASSVGDYRCIDPASDSGCSEVVRCDIVEADIDELDILWAQHRRTPRTAMGLARMPRASKMSAKSLPNVKASDRSTAYRRDFRFQIGCRTDH